MIQYFDLVVAMDCQRGIGKAGQLPWCLPGDLKYFKHLTSTVSSAKYLNAIIMGRRTWESIPDKKKPLSNRLNVVITRDASYTLPQGVLSASSLDNALEILQNYSIEHCFVIGGGEIYQLALEHPGCKTIYVTALKAKFDCDTFFPDFESKFVPIWTSELHKDNEIEYVFRIYKKTDKSDE